MDKRPVRLELSCGHVMAIPRERYTRNLGVVWCGECDKPRDLGQAYALPEESKK